MKVANFGSDKIENLGNEERTTSAAGKFAYRLEEGNYGVQIGWLKD